MKELIRDAIIKRESLNAGLESGICLSTGVLTESVSSRTPNATPGLLAVWTTVPQVYKQCLHSITRNDYRYNGMDYHLKYITHTPRGRKVLNCPDISAR